jgi:N-acetylglutamate synthase-like GNAT family acetyltransferase
MYQVEICKSEKTLDAVVDLRYAVLRKPWNKLRETVTDDLESNSINAYIQKNNTVIACGRLQNNGDGIGQIRYMAIDSNYQGQGLGKLILKRLEVEGKKIGLKKIELQARENAVEFYKTCGYIVKEKSFFLWDIIQHYLMTKAID